MNEIDVRNIKRIIRFRSSQPYETGGEIAVSDLENKSTEELGKLVKSFEDAERKKEELIVKQNVDEIFKKFSKTGDNMIALCAAWCPERKIYNVEECIFDYIDFYDPRYNKLYQPINETELSESDYEKYYKLIESIWDKLFIKLKVPLAADYWKKDPNALNDCWYGVIGIMKDYTVVSFVIRNDGLLSDSYYKEVVYKIV